MPCQNAEVFCHHLEDDICEKCLKKVQKSTEEPLSAEEKRNRILWDLSFIAATGVLWCLSSKMLSIIAIDYVDSILETIARPTE